MKPYQIYKVSRFPKEPKPLTADYQMTLLEGHTDSASTKIRPLVNNYAHGFDSFEIDHDMLVNGIGYTTVNVDGRIREVSFMRYKYHVAFKMYYHEEENIVLFNASRDICKDVFSAIETHFPTIKLEEITFDFAKAAHSIVEYTGAWFKGVSSAVKSAAIMGTHVEEDELFKKLSKVGQLSNITIPFEYNKATHRIMITKTSAIVFVESYPDEKFEIDLGLQMYQKLIKNVWHDKS